MSDDLFYAILSFIVIVVLLFYTPPPTGPQRA